MQYVFYTKDAEAIAAAPAIIKEFDQEIVVENDGEPVPGLFMATGKKEDLDKLAQKMKGWTAGPLRTISAPFAHAPHFG